MNSIHYVNLTNGIEDIDKLDNCRFIRIQSTHLEQNHFEEVLMDLDNDLLMNLALGNKCIIHDKASRRGKLSRAVWYGIPWIRYALERAWFDKNPESVLVKNCNNIKYFDKLYRSLSMPTKRKLKYYKKFLFCDHVEIDYVCDRTIHDGDHEYYRQILEETLINAKETDRQNLPERKRTKENNKESDA